MSSYGTFEITTYCLCGGSMKGSGAGELEAVTELQEAWWTVHSDEGHGPATQKQAAAARRKQARQWQKDIADV